MWATTIGIIVTGMKRTAHPRLGANFVYFLCENDLHAKRVLSLANAVTGVIVSGALAIHAIGRGLAAAKGLAEKQAVKQVDRLIGNRKLDLDDFFNLWVPYVLSGRTAVVINLDWTDFDDEDHTMLVASVQTKHGRATPLLWKTVHKSELKDRRAGYEDDLLVRLRQLIPRAVKVTIVADRGICDQDLYHFLEAELGFEYVIRLRGNITVTDEQGESRPAKEWVGPGGRMRVLRKAQVTAKRCPVSTVICVHEKGMKDPWCIVASDSTLMGSEVKKYYGKRFSCEETFRDLKDLHFGLGMEWERIKRPDRRDRMMMLGVLATTLLTLLGEAGERAGLDRLLKTNTSPKRQLSLFRQGLRWYHLLPTLREDRLKLLMDSFVSVMAEHELCRELYGAI